MEKQNQDTSSPVMIGINPELYQQLAKVASQRNISLQEYIEDILEQTVLLERKILQQQRHPMSRETYEGLLQLREQIKQDRQGRPFDDSTEIIRQMREERSRYLGEL